MDIFNETLKKKLLHRTSCWRLKHLLKATNLKQTWRSPRHSPDEQNIIFFLMIFYVFKKFSSVIIRFKLDLKFKFKHVYWNFTSTGTAAFIFSVRVTIEFLLSKTEGPNNSPELNVHYAFCHGFHRTIKSSLWYWNTLYNKIYYYNRNRTFFFFFVKNYFKRRRYFHSYDFLWFRSTVLPRASGYFFEILFYENTLLLSIKNPKTWVKRTISTNHLTGNGFFPPFTY